MAFFPFHKYILQPTSSPTDSFSPTTSDIPLQSIGNNGIPSEVFPLGECQGDCDNDAECAGDLICFKRSANEVVPGCVGPGESKEDYCYNMNPGNPTTVAPSASPFAKPTQNPTNQSPSNAPSKVPTGQVRILFQNYCPCSFSNVYML